jgi:radical SAM protein with 4Fe4S-binding SPASM domain
MSLENVLLSMQEKYDCSEPLYLSNFFKPNGKKWLYDKLKNLYQPVYQNRYRILLIQDCADIYDYSDLPGSMITTIQKYASQIDISNSFILLLTNNRDIGKELETARELYSTDICSIQYHLIDSLPFSLKSNSKKDTFCVLPWMHLYVGTDGNVLPCCQADHQFPMGNINSQSIIDIVKSQPFNQLRANMIAGSRSKECARCYQHEDSGLPSPRLNHNSRWSNVDVDHINPNGFIEEFKPVYLDIRLNNICNLKCRMCSGYFSSAIAREEVELFGNTNSVDSTLGSQKRKSGLAEILQYLPTAEKIYFAGGEPLLASEHYEILHTLISCGNTDLEIIYNTNFTTLRYQQQSVLDLWKQFSNIEVGASLDAMGEVAEYIRHGTNWKTIESNLQSVKTECPHVKFTVTSTVGLLNIPSLIDLQKLWHTDGTLDLSKFSLSVMLSPDHLTVCVLPLEHKKRLDIIINRHIHWCEEHSAYSLAKKWKDVLTYMWSRDDSHQLSKFRRLTQFMDNHRKQSLSNTIPELQNLLL